MGHNHVHSRVSTKKLLWAIFVNVLITVAELVGGALTGLLALVADGVHNLSDVAALVLALLGAKGSEAPATKKSTYGFKRVEVMTALISAAALVAIAVFIFVEAYDRWQQPVPITRPWIFLSIAVIGLLGNLFSVWFLSSERGKSLNMKTAYLHMAYDAISSVAVIAGGVVIILTGWVLIDVIMSTFIALMILWSSYMVIKEAVLIFLEAVPSGIDFDDVHQAILDIPRVKEVHDLHIWSLSSLEVALSCHICLEEKDFQSGPDIIVEINSMLSDRFKIGHGTLQIEKERCARSDLLCRNDDHHWE